MISGDFGEKMGLNNLLMAAYATARLLRLADGPDELHRNQLARFELKRYRNTDPAVSGGNAEVIDLTDLASDFAHLRPGAPGYLWQRTT